MKIRLPILLSSIFLLSMFAWPHLGIGESKPLTKSTVWFLPDPKLTPGATNQEISESKYRELCKQKGWTRLYRPPVSFTNKLKQLQMRKYGYSDLDPRDYEEDHLIPLCLAGASQDPHNLWPQPRSGEWNADDKDKLEAKLCSLVCRGKVPLTDAQRDIARNWIGAYQKYVSGKEQHDLKRMK